MLLAQLTEQYEYQNATRAFCNFSVHEQKRTPKGLLYIDKFGTLCHAANVAFICLEAADYSKNYSDSQEYRQFAKEQIDYMLGAAGKIYNNNKSLSNLLNINCIFIFSIFYFCLLTKTYMIFQEEVT